MDVTFDNLKILLVDPNRHIRSLVRGVLAAFRVHDVREASDGAEAFKEWRTFAADLIITEFMMTPVDGVEFVHLVRTASDSPNPYVPIIMLTGYTERHNVAKARDAGISEFLAKPISAQTLYARLTAAVFRPRPFVRLKTYFGPDRRRHSSVTQALVEERRHSDSSREQPLSRQEVDRLMNR